MRARKSWYKFRDITVSFTYNLNLLEICIPHEDTAPSTEVGKYFAIFLNYITLSFRASHCGLHLLISRLLFFGSEFHFYRAKFFDAGEDIITP